MNSAARFFILAMLFCAPAWSATITENFDSTTKADLVDTEPIWNFSLGYVHPTLFLTLVEYPALTYLPDRTIPVGDGSHGAFNISTYQNFSSGGDISGQIIRIDTDEFFPLKVTEFILDAGWTVEPVGSNPLVIQSLSDVRISGKINCAGENGQAINADANVIPQGGRGRCGGKDGGSGGSLTVAATRGTSSNGTTVTGGHPGTAQNAVTGGDGGGGGGAYGTSTGPTNGANPSAAGNSVAGAALDEPTFAEEIGGSGGGGGAPYTVVSAEQSSGGGGGGGGGVVLIYAVQDFEVTATGEVRADGGVGGGDAGALLAGGGGGGGAGSILVWVAGNFTIGGANRVTANNGAGGVTSGGDGGRGSIGRTWVTAKGSYFGFSEIPTTTLVYPGDVQFQTGDQTAYSTAYDLGNTKPLITAVTADTTGTGAVQIEVSGSSDNFVNDETAWTNVNSLIGVSGKRYLKFRAVLNGTDANDPIILRTVSIDYEGGRTDQFNFVASCGRIGPNNLNGYLNVLILALLLLAARKVTTTLVRN